MGILPLQYQTGESAEKLGLTGEEEFSILGVSSINALKPVLTVSAKKTDGSQVDFSVTALIDTPLELAYFLDGGLTHKVLKGF